MSKAEERAQTAYPTWRNDMDDKFNSSSAYCGFVKGYEQAEKDLELTWKDVEKICLIAKESHKFYGFWSEIVYDDILKRFKERKETKD